MVNFSQVSVSEVTSGSIEVQPALWWNTAVPRVPVTTLPERK